MTKKITESILAGGQREWWKWVKEVSRGHNTK